MPDVIAERSYAKLLLDKLGQTPSSVVAGDKPDLCVEVSDRKVGIEVTDATPEEFNRAIKGVFGVRGWPGPFPSNLQHRATRRTNDELRKEGPSWKDCSDTFKLWTERIEERLRDKERAFNQASFQKFTENWLLIVDPENLLVDRGDSESSREVFLIEARRFFASFAPTFKPVLFFDQTFILISDTVLITWDHRTMQVTYSVT